MKRPKYLSERDLGLFKQAIMKAASIDSVDVRIFTMSKIIGYITEGWAWSGNHRAVEELIELMDSWEEK